MHMPRRMTMAMNQLAKNYGTVLKMCSRTNTMERKIAIHYMLAIVSISIIPINVILCDHLSTQHTIGQHVDASHATASMAAVMNETSAIELSVDIAKSFECDCSEKFSEHISAECSQLCEGSVANHRELIEMTERKRDLNWSNDNRGGNNNNGNDRRHHIANDNVDGQNENGFSANTELSDTLKLDDGVNATQAMSEYADTLLSNGRNVDKHININEYFIDNDGGYLGDSADVGGASPGGIGESGPGDDVVSNSASAPPSVIDGYNLYNNSCVDENCPDYNITCVGEPIYCNYTYEEYVQMLYDYIYPTVPEWILIISHSVVFIMGLIGNALVCIAVYTNYTMRTVTNIFIVNLAIADFFVILFCLPPTVVWDVTETWFMGETMCKVVLYFQTVSVTVSVLTLTFISLDRWYAICFPLRYVSTNGRAIGSIAFIWTLAVVSDIPEFLYSTTQKKELRFDIDLFTQCIATWDNDTEKNIYIGRFLTLYVGPLILMTVAYFQIVRVLWKSDTIPGHHLRSGTAANSSTMGQLRARRKAAKMLVAVVVMFAMCYFPVHFLNILRYTIDIGQSEVIAVLSLISHWLMYANSAINPVIYNFMSGKFRREFRNALEKCRCGRIRVEDRSLYHSAPATRINNISPSSRSNYQLTSVRDITCIRDRHTLQTSFMENGGGSTNGQQQGNLHSHHYQPPRDSINSHQTTIDNRIPPKTDPGP